MSVEKAIGRLEEQGNWIKAEIVDLKKDVKTLLTWRWKIYGASAIITVITAGVFEIFLRFMEH